MRRSRWQPCRYFLIFMYVTVTRLLVELPYPFNPLAMQFCFFCSAVRLFTTVAKNRNLLFGVQQTKKLQRRTKYSYLFGKPCSPHFLRRWRREGGGEEGENVIYERWKLMLCWRCHSVPFPFCLSPPLPCNKDRHLQNRKLPFAQVPLYVHVQQKCHYSATVEYVAKKEKL